MRRLSTLYWNVDSCIPLAGGSQVFVRGWCFHTAASIVGMSVVTRREIVPCVWGLERPEISAAYAKIAQVGHCGFTARFRSVRGSKWFRVTFSDGSHVLVPLPEHFSHRPFGSIRFFVRRPRALFLSLIGSLVAVWTKRTASLSICATFFNEARYLREWIEFHRLVGVERFYLYNHMSTDDYLHVLLPYIWKGIVVLRHCCGIYPLFQLDCFEDCLVRSQTATEWLAFIDVDEFLFSLEKDDLRVFLEEFQSFPALVVHWRMFMTGGQLRETKAPVIERFTRCFAGEEPCGLCNNRVVKSIVRPAQTMAMPSAHYGVFRERLHAVNEAREPVESCWWFTPVRAARIRVNHYFTRSAEEYEEKKAKLETRKIWRTRKPRRILPDEAALPQCDDRAILRFLPALKERLRGISS